MMMMMTGNRFMLIALDLCTHNLEAMLLKQHTAQDVAGVLANVFSHFGFSQEILSDQGSNFRICSYADLPK